MDKIKKIFSSSHEGDETKQTGDTANTTHTGTSHTGTSHTGTSQAGTTQSGTTRTSGLTGEGSHLGSSRNATTGNTSEVIGTSSTSQGEYGNTDLGSTIAGSGMGNTHTGGVTSGTGHHSGLDSSTGVTTTTTTTPGPHASNLANKADPRVDSNSSRSFPLSGGVASANSGTNLGSNAGYSGTNTGANVGHTGSGLTGQSIPDRTAPGVTGTNTSPSHHLSRDAAATGTAAAVGSGVSHHQSNVGTTGTTGSSGVAGTNTSSGHHPGRDIAAAGTTGAVGSGVGHHQSNVDTSSSRGFHTASGPHQTDIANLLDPSVNNTGSTETEDAIRHSSHGGGAEQADRDHPKRATNTGSADATRIGDTNLTSSTHGIGGTSNAGHSTHGPTGSSHHGRDAAFGAGAVGAAGLAKHEHDSHRDEQSTGIGDTSSTRTGQHGLHNDRGTSVGGTSNIGSTTSSSGHHLGRDAAIGTGAAGATGLATHGVSGRRDIESDYDQYGNPVHSSTGKTQHYAEDAERGHGQHHTGRDAALVGGAAGAGGTAAYLAGKHHNQGTSTAASGNTGNGPNPVQQSERMHEKNLGEPSHPAITGGVTAGTETLDGTDKAKPDTDNGRSKDHNYGRDAAVAGGVGGVAYEADKHNKHDQGKLDKHNHQNQDTCKTESHSDRKGRGILSFLHRDKNKKYSKEEEEEFVRQEREHNAKSSHTGRDAALGGAAGVGAYEATKHHGQQGAGTQDALASQTGHAGSSLATDPDSHGAAVLAETPTGKDLGDKLHGIDRNRGVKGTSGFQGAPGFGDGQTTGPHHGVGAQHRVSDQHGHSTGSTAAGLGAAGAGAAAIGAHGYNRHQTGTTHQQTGLTGSTYQSGLSGGHSSGMTGSSAHTSSAPLTGRTGGDYSPSKNYTTSLLSKRDMVQPVMLLLQWARVDMAQAWVRV
ncbi:hypothetical protein B0J14DRAFT_578748 [Halenospora varia]|nr:hypothetical protein B0J14DRAFT_578748 [Halenospora varia]